MTSIERSRPLLAAAGFFAVLSTGSIAWAQEDTVYIGGGAQRGTVQVDMSVLDDVGSAGRGGQALLPPGQPQRITLTPPGQKKAAPQHRTTTTAKPVTPRKAPAPTTRAAAPETADKAATPATVAKAASPAPALAISDLPPSPPAPIEITMPPPAPAAEPKSMAAAPASSSPIAPAVAKAAEAPVSTPAAAPRDLKPAKAAAPVMATKEPPAAVASAVRLPEADTSVMATAMSSDPTPVTTPAVAPAPATPTRAAAPAPEMPKPAPQAVPDMATTQTVALAPTSQGTGDAGKQSARIAFSGEAATLPEPAKGDLKQIAGSLVMDPSLRVQVMAYARGSDDASKARRLSLSRALAVRSYLIEQGIGSTRIDVRALGNAAEGGPSDRVDLMVLSR